MPACAFAPGGDHIVSGSHDRTLRLWSIADYREMRILGSRVLEDHADAVLGAAFSSDRDHPRIVSASRDRTARIWDPASGRVIRELTEGHDFLVSACLFWSMALSPDRVRCVAFSPGGGRVILGTDKHGAQVWDITRAEPRRTDQLDGHSAGVAAVAFSAKGDRAITGGDDNRAIVWDLSGAKPAVVCRLEGHSAGITAVVFSPSGLRAITGSEDRTAKVWDARTGKEILTLKGHSQEVTAVDFSPDGLVALTGSRDGTLVLWPAAEWRSPVASSTAVVADSNSVECGSPND